MKDQPSMTKRKFLYNLSRASYQKSWGKNYQPPTFGENFLAFLMRIIPKIGPLKVLQLRTPTPETERMFEASFNASLDRYRKLLGQVGTGQPDLPNDNFDTGQTTGPGKYRLNLRRQHHRWWPAMRMLFLNTAQAKISACISFLRDIFVSVLADRSASRTDRSREYKRR